MEEKMNISVQMNEELMMKLAEIRKEYRGATVSQAIRWLVEDKWTEMQAEKRNEGTRGTGG